MYSVYIKIVDSFFQSLHDYKVKNLVIVILSVLTATGVR